MLLTTLFAIASLGGAPAAPFDDCDSRRIRDGSRTSTSIHSDNDDDNAVMTFTSWKDDKCQSATIVGKIGYTANEDDILSMPFGAYATFRERTGGQDRALSVTRGSSGEIIRAYQLNGRAASFDDDGHRWLADFLPRVLAQAGINVRPRVARWRARGGVDNVLNNIAALGSSGAMRAHYEALLNGERLSDDELDRTLRNVTDNMRGSSGDMRAILTRLAPGARISRSSLPSLERAFTSIASSGDKAAVLEAFGQAGDRDVLMAVMRAAGTIPSSGDKGRLLQLTAARFLSSTDRAMHDVYFDVAGSVPSSGDLRNVMHSAIPYAARDEDVARQVIATARRIPSSGDRAAVLMELITSGAVKSDRLRDAFLQAAGEIPSDGDRARVLRAAVETRGS